MPPVGRLLPQRWSVRRVFVVLLGVVIFLQIVLLLSRSGPEKGVVENWGEPGATFSCFGGAATCEIISRIACGGFGCVFKIARHNMLGAGSNKIMAMKTISLNDKEGERFQTAPSHPNIVEFYGTEVMKTSRGVLRAVFMEYCSEGTLADWEENGRLYTVTGRDSLAPRKRIESIALQLARGLAALHSRGLIHQDFKPQNVLMCGDGVPKIMDLGTVADVRWENAIHPVTKRQHQTPRAALQPGTVPYASPEQMKKGYFQLFEWLGNSQSRSTEATQRTDTWSWAITVLEMFYGPRSVDSPAALSQKKPKVELSSKWWDLLAECLQEDPALRPTLEDVAKWFAEG